MRALVLAVVMLVGCAVDETSESVSTIGSADEFGFSCRQSGYNPEHLVTYCYANSGAVGICAYRGICFPKCETEDSGCPAGHLAVPTIGKDENGVGNCTCYPVHCAEPLLAHEYGIQDPLPVNCGPVDRAP